MLLVHKKERELNDEPRNSATSDAATGANYAGKATYITRAHFDFTRQSCQLGDRRNYDYHLITSCGVVDISIPL